MITSRLYLGAALALFFFVATRILRLFKLRNYPSAPGPALAKYTNWWYLWEISKGKFQYWDIDQHAKYGPVIRVAPNMYSIDDPDAIKQIYGISSQMTKGAWYSVWGDPNEPSLFSEPDRQIHAVLRKGVANLYAMTSIKSYERFVDGCVGVLQSTFDRFAAEGTTIDVQRWMQAYAFDVIGEITFGTRLGFMESGGLDVDGIIENLDNSVSFSTRTGVDGKVFPLCLAYYGHPLKGIIAFREKLMRKRDINDATRGNDSKGAQNDFYSKCLEMQAKDPEAYVKQRKHQVMFVNLAAGSDTTSIALTSAVYQIANNRAVYLKLREEVKAAEERGQVSNPITFEEALGLPYLQLVIKEALRIHPSTGFPLWRVVPAGGMEIAGKFFPPGAEVGVNTWVAHFNPSVFENPGAFKPERWDPEVVSKEKLKEMENSYMPFGLGTRTCIGKNISIMEMTKLIPQLVRRYDFDLLNPTGNQPVESSNNWFVKQKDVYMKVRSRPY